VGSAIQAEGAPRISAHTVVYERQSPVVTSAGKCRVYPSAQKNRLHHRIGNEGGLKI
jgi:hypothetical protein